MISSKNEAQCIVTLCIKTDFQQKTYRLYVPQKNLSLLAQLYVLMLLEKVIPSRECTSSRFQNLPRFRDLQIPGNSPSDFLTVLFQPLRNISKKILRKFLSTRKSSIMRFHRKIFNYVQKLEISCKKKLFGIHIKPLETSLHRNL